MNHRLAAFFADLARGLGKCLHFAGKPIIGRSYDRAISRFSFGNIVTRLFHSAGEIIFNEGKMPTEAKDNLFAKESRHEKAFSVVTVY